MEAMTWMNILFMVMISHLRKMFIKSMHIFVIHIEHYVMCYFCKKNYHCGKWLRNIIICVELLFYLNIMYICGIKTWNL
jgi:hypothetical protein